MLQFDIVIGLLTDGGKEAEAFQHPQPPSPGAALPSPELSARSLKHNPLFQRASETHEIHLQRQFKHVG